MSILSLSWVFSGAGFPAVPNCVPGILGWSTLVCTILLLTFNRILSFLPVFLLFLGLGYFLGPYLEPPADPLEHLRRTYAVCNKQSDSISKINRGFFHYNMSGLALCPHYFEEDPGKTLNTIDLFHGLYWGFLAVVLVIVGRAAGLPGSWALFSGLIAFLFFGTNRFSYFSYYSFAPSFSSLAFFWIWVAAFYFRTRGPDILKGLLAAAVMVPILWANHEQETVFLVIIVMLWSAWNIHGKVWQTLGNHFKSKSIYLKLIYLTFVLVCLFLVPQLELFQKVIGKVSINNYWSENQKFILSWGRFHVGGNIIGNRISDTLGILGFAPLLLFPITLMIRGELMSCDRVVRIFLLALVPFIIYFVPALHIVWLFNVKPVVYWRICYAAMYWLAIAVFLYCLFEFLQLKLAERKVPESGNPGQVWRVTGFRPLLFTVCMCSIVLLSGFRSSPVYGKLDFILLDGRPWWRSWNNMITSTMKDQRKLVISDPMTSSVLNGVFNMPAVHFRELGRFSVKDVSEMNEQNRYDGYRCIINLTGFTPTWVAAETGHWQSDLAVTRRYYTFSNDSGEKTRILNGKSKNGCTVY